MAKLCLEDALDSAQHYSEGWYAVRARVRSEQGISKLLDGAGFTSFVPFWEERRKSRRGENIVSTAAFPGYLFCRFALADIFRVLNTPGVQQVIGFSGPARIDDATIDSLKRAFNGQSRVFPAAYLNNGDAVEVIRGPMRGTLGVLVRVKDQYRLAIQVHILQRSVYTEIDADAVRPLHPASAAA
jgi:transcription antitermination factor NusG